VVSALGAYKKGHSKSRKLSIWKNKELSSTAFSGKQNYDYWQLIFETGKSPQGFQIMPQGLDLDELLKE
jgi:hypothetical protein